jgi:hypothetical protein
MRLTRQTGSHSEEVVKYNRRMRLDLFVILFAIRQMSSFLVVRQVRSDPVGHHHNGVPLPANREKNRDL